MPTNHSASDGPEELKELAKKYRVCWEVWPEYLIVERNKRQVGFELVLAGVHEEGAHPTPGCPNCLDLFQHLKKIADWLLPDQERQSKYEIETFDSSIHRVAKRRMRPEIMLSLKILHRQGYDRPVGACEEDCLREMQEKLERIGAQRELWQERR